jgi:flagellar biosynthetic protein FliO
MDTVFTALRVAVSLGAVLGLIWYLRKRIATSAPRGGKRAKAVNVVGKQGIGAKASIVVVETEGRRFVLGVTEHSVNVLHVAETPSTDELVFAEAMAGLTDDASDPEAHDASGQAVSPVAGSILAASTWKRAAAALGLAAK